MAEAVEQGERIWGGTTLDARQAKRRRSLIAAGFDLLGREGAAAVSVRGVTRAAKLSERYFYESFASRDELLLAVHDEVATQARSVIAEAISELGSAEDAGEAFAVDPLDAAVAGLSAFTDFLDEDPRRGRVLLQEAFGDPLLVKHGVELLPSFAALVVEQIGARFDEPDETDAEISGVALAGALTHLYLAWLDGTLKVSRERLVDHAAQLVVAVAQAHSG
jgi:AcrR family transcriptional regulator